MPQWYDHRIRDRARLTIGQDDGFQCPAVMHDVLFLRLPTFASGSVYVLCDAMSCEIIGFLSNQTADGISRSKDVSNGSFINFEILL